MVWIQAGVLMESWAWCQGREQAGGLTERHNNGLKEEGTPRWGEAERHCVHRMPGGEGRPRRREGSPADRRRRTEDGAGIWPDGGCQWRWGLGGAPGWAQGRMQGREVQTAPNVQSPARALRCEREHMDGAAAKGRVSVGPGVGGFSSLGVSSSTFVIC